MEEEVLEEYKVEETKGDGGAVEVANQSEGEEVWTPEVERRLDCWRLIVKERGSKQHRRSSGMISSRREREG